jgi:hypothetical protein
MADGTRWETVLSFGCDDESDLEQNQLYLPQLFHSLSVANTKKINIFAVIHSFWYCLQHVSFTRGENSPESALEDQTRTPHREYGTSKEALLLL